MALIKSETATMVVVLALLVIVKSEQASVPEVAGRTFIKFDDKNSATCLQDARVSILKDFLPVHEELNTDHHEYRCQLPHGKKPEDVTDDQWGETQYVTLYNAEERIPIFSAYKAEPYIDPGTDKKTKDTGDRAKMAWEEADGDSPKSSDYSLFQDYDRGHLFPVRLASDKVQAQATMKLTNAVPQNSIFNQNQWNWAGENILMTTAVKDCQKRNWTPIVLTGAVPDYWVDPDTEVSRSKSLKIGRKTDDQSKGFPYDFPGVAFDRREDKIRVPTHMWSACFCVDEHNTARNFLGFIGINLRVGHVKWYSNFVTFDATLTKMYGINSPNFFPVSAGRQSDRLAIQKMEEILKDAKGSSKSETVKNKMVLPSANDDENYWDREEHSIEKLIGKTMQQEINVAYNLYHNIFPESKKRAATVTIGEPPKKRPRTTTPRKKRSVTTSPVHSQYALIKVVDASSTSDLSLTTCTFKESYDGGEKTHELNFEEGAFIKDPKPTGEAELSAVVNENPVPERASTTQHISIVLTGRT